MKTLRTPALALLAFATLGLGACTSTNEENAEAPPAAEAAPMDSSTPPADPAAPPPADATTPAETAPPPPPAGTP